jgi:type I restriction enzyme S subunit
MMEFEKLKNILEVKKGKKPSFVDVPDEHSVRVLQIDDLRNDDAPKYTNDKTGVLANENDILIAWDGANAGTIGYGKSGYIGSTIALLRKKHPDSYSTIFIGKFLQSKYDHLRGKTTGATIPHISRKALDDLEIPVISLDAQRHIASLLSQAESLIARRKESLHLLDDYLKSVFLEMFGDPVRNEKQFSKISLSSISKIGTGGTPSRKRESEFYGGNIPWVKTTEVKGVPIHDTEEKITPLAVKSSNCKVYPIDTILLAMYGQGKTRGNVGVLKIEAATNQACAAIIPNPTCNSVFLFEQLKQLYSHIRSLAKGSNQENLNLEIVRNIQVILPPIALQIHFAQIVKKTEALKRQYQQSLAELEQLYGSLSQKAFKGELWSESEK